jgi:outer membrane receptor protein involved in Fe transport
MRAKKKIVALAISLVSINSAFADDKLDEVVVTAQKRIESMKDVPISVAVVSADTIEKMGVLKIEDIIPFTNNINYTESGLSTQVRIRGIGSGNSQGFEQSVAQYMDGVYYGRAPLFRAPIYDISHVEILRGSQNALFGKDSIAGAVSINTANPTKEFEGYAHIGYIPHCVGCCE